jgi:putative restriction endonuclease
LPDATVYGRRAKGRTSAPATNSSSGRRIQAAVSSHARTLEDAREVTATEGVPWPDHAERNYQQRFDIEIRNDTGGDTLPHRWGELQEWAGFKQPALSSIVEIPSSPGRERLRHLFSDAGEIPPAIRNQVDAVREEVHSDKDARNFTWRAIAERQGQQHFRDELIKAYDSSCCVTGCDAVPALEAAHIAPYRGEHTNEVWNGLLLRADIHTLFDLFALTVDASTRTIRQGSGKVVK